MQPPSEQVMEDRFELGDGISMRRTANPCEIRLDVDPRLISEQDVDVRERAAATRAAPPQHVLEMPWDECGDEDIIMNEALHRPTTSAGFLKILLEVQQFAGDSADQVSESLGLSVSWNDMKRSIISQAVRRDGEFSLAEVICEALCP